MERAIDVTMICNKMKEKVLSLSQNNANKIVLN
ncbi:hypothetical protein PTE_03578 [Photorhabdus khanii NC19]|uniref:Uncharacterized protein n=1 Tax=Photorhabdus khanii NC19 TaxID=1004151 RepID=W3V5B7_9GAMM|nr:hypothetical protein PTE_03578 [Photorhabdus khanii NC19]